MKKYLLNSRLFLGVCVLGALMCSIQPRCANAQAAPTNPQAAPANPQADKTTDYYLNQLKDASESRRIEAYRKLADFDDRLHISVVAVLEELKKNPDRRFGGSFEMTLRVVSAMNIRDALDSVGGMIDFQLDPTTMRVGGFGGVSSYYPVAKTVIDLNDGPQTIEIVMERFDREATETTLRVYTYVLHEVLGTKIARFVLQNNLERANQQVILMPNAILIKISKANLEEALKLLDKVDNNESILKMPEGA